MTSCKECTKQLSMARLLGLELVTLLLLGFVMGLLSFMYWNAKRELSSLFDENERLSKQAVDSASQLNIYRYKKSLAESDLQQLRKDGDAQVQNVMNLTARVLDLKQLLVGQCWENSYPL